MRAAISLVVILSACGGDVDALDGSADCATTISITPASPRSGDTVRATATLNVSGVATYTWSVTFGGGDVGFSLAAADQSAIEFIPAVDGTYEVDVAVTVPGENCSGAMAFVDVGESNAAGEIVLRPHSDYELAPVTYPLNLIAGADKELGSITVGPGRTASGAVKLNSANEAAFIRFPAGTSTPPTPMIEVFTEADGSFSVPIGPDTQTMIVVPSTPGIPWRSFTAASSQTLTLTAGTALSGTVRTPTGSLLSGARVQIIDTDGAASTVGTSNGAGAFTLNVSRTGTFAGTITVTPPTASGLPRLTGVTSFGAATIDVRYNPALVMRDAGGTQVTRSGALPNADVTIVGSIPLAGSVTAAIGEGDLAGTVRIATTTTGAGQLPALQVPAAALSAVVSPGAGDFAVAPFVTTTAVPASITAPAMTAFSTRIIDMNNAELPGAVIALEPMGALAQAGAPTVTVFAGTDALAAGSLAVGATYRVRASDPEGRAGTRIQTDVGEVGASLQLPNGVRVSGALTGFGSTNRLAASVVEIYCSGCSKDPAAVPLAQGVTDLQGRFSLTVTDPGAL